MAEPAACVPFGVCQQEEGTAASGLIPRFWGLACEGRSRRAQAAPPHPGAQPGPWRATRRLPATPLSRWPAKPPPSPGVRVRSLLCAVKWSKEVRAPGSALESSGLLFTDTDSQVPLTSTRTHDPNQSETLWLVPRSQRFQNLP